MGREGGVDRWEGRRMSMQRRRRGQVGGSMGRGEAVGRGQGCSGSWAGRQQRRGIGSW